MKAYNQDTTFPVKKLESGMLDGIKKINDNNTVTGMQFVNLIKAPG